MVYLIESEGRNETYYKIGYAKDGSFDKRLIAYKLHNPFCKVLYTIPEMAFIATYKKLMTRERYNPTSVLKTTSVRYLSTYLLPCILELTER